MKKLFRFFLIAAFILGGSVSAFAYQDDGNVHSTESSNATAADPVRVYQLVRYPVTAAGNSTSVSTTVSAGDVVVWDTVSDDGVTINVVNAGSQSCDAVAGIVVSPTITGDTGAVSAVSDIGHKNWGYIQTYGLNTTAKITGAVVFAGQALAADPTTPGYFTGITSGANAQINRTRAGFAYDTQGSTSSSVEVFVNLR